MSGAGRVVLARERQSTFPPADVLVVMEPTRNAWVPLAARFRRHGADVVLVPPERAADLCKYYSIHSETDRHGDRAIGDPRELVDSSAREVEVNLRSGIHAATIWTNQLTYDYVGVNAEYSTWHRRVADGARVSQQLRVSAYLSNTALSAVQSILGGTAPSSTSPGANAA